MKEHSEGNEHQKVVPSAEPFELQGEEKIDKLEDQNRFGTIVDLSPQIPEDQAWTNPQLRDAFKRETSRVRSLIRKMLDYDTLDVEQEVILTIYTKQDSLKAGSSYTGWIIRVTTNKCLDELRRRKATDTHTIFEDPDIEDSHLGNVPDKNPLPEEIVETRELQEEIVTAILGLPKIYQELVFLRYHGLSDKEIAKILNKPHDTVKTYLKRAKPLLREVLADVWKEFKNEDDLGK